MENQTYNQSLSLFLKTEIRFFLFIVISCAIGALACSYFGLREIAVFSWEYMLGLLLAYPFLSFLNRRYMRII